MGKDKNESFPMFFNHLLTNKMLDMSVSSGDTGWRRGVGAVLLNVWNEINSHEKGEEILRIILKHVKKEERAPCVNKK